MANGLNFLLPINLFVIGCTGVFVWRKNLVSILISLEIMFISANLGFVLAAIQIDDALGFVISLLSLTTAGLEISIGIALVLMVYRRYGSVETKKITKIKS